jgi:hypothetical protein
MDENNKQSFICDCSARFGGINLLLYAHRGEFGY